MAVTISQLSKIITLDDLKDLFKKNSCEESFVVSDMDYFCMVYNFSELCIGLTWITRGIYHRTNGPHIALGKRDSPNFFNFWQN
jgi:hypothetical protein